MACSVASAAVATASKRLSGSSSSVRHGAVVVGAAEDLELGRLGGGVGSVVFGGGVGSVGGGGGVADLLELARGDADGAAAAEGRDTGRADRGRRSGRWRARRARRARR